MKKLVALLLSLALLCTISLTTTGCSKPNTAPNPAGTEKEEKKDDAKAETPPKEEVK